MSLSALIKRGGVALRTKAAVRLPHKGRPPCIQRISDRSQEASFVRPEPWCDGAQTTWPSAAGSLWRRSRVQRSRMGQSQWRLRTREPCDWLLRQPGSSSSPRTAAERACALPSRATHRTRGSGPINSAATMMGEPRGVTLLLCRIVRHKLRPNHKGSDGGGTLISGEIDGLPLGVASGWARAPASGQR